MTVQHIQETAQGGKALQSGIQIPDQMTAPQKILFYTTLRPYDWNISTLKNNKVEPLHISNEPALNYNLVSHPEGRYGVVTSEMSGIAKLYLMDLQNPSEKLLPLTDGDCFEDQAAFSPDGKWLYFVCSRDGSADIFRMPFCETYCLSKIGEAQNLTHSNEVAANLKPAISPDGKRMAFSSNRHTQAPVRLSPRAPANLRAGNIYVMSADGTGEAKRLTINELWDGSPVWDKEGKYIYFYSSRMEGNVTHPITRLCRVSKDGGDLEEIISSHDTQLLAPVFMRGQLGYTAKKIKEKEPWHLMFAHPDGLDLKVEKDNVRDFWATGYNPKMGCPFGYGTGKTSKPLYKENNATFTGKPIASGPFLDNKAAAILFGQSYDVYRIRGNFAAVNEKSAKVAWIGEGFKAIYTSNFDGSEEQCLFNAGETRYFGLSWSKDGQWLVTAHGNAFAADEERVDIIKFRPDGSECINLTSHLPKGNHGSPSFSPDGKKIVFSSSMNGSKNLYVMEAEPGKIPLRLTTDNARDIFPAFSPDGQHIVFTRVVEGKNYQLSLIELNKEGSAEKLIQLTEGTSAKLHPTFSDDGKQIFYVSDMLGFFDEVPNNPVFAPQPYGNILGFDISDLLKSKSENYPLKDGDLRIVRITQSKWEEGLPCAAGSVLGKQ